MLRYKNSLLERILLEKGKPLFLYLSVDRSTGMGVGDVGSSVSQVTCPLG